VTVETAEELVAAIDSNTAITLKSGVYNLSKLKQEYSEDSVFWEEVFDGNQLIIKGIKNLTLQGEGDTPAEIVVEPRYANVLNFRDSSNITIRNIIAGHTPEQGGCAGGVLAFEDCSNITILESDLYGCGIEGLTLLNTQSLMFANSAVHDCNTAIMTIEDSRNISFYNSTFYDNQCYSYGIEARNNCSLTFEGCDFKNNMILGGIFFELSLSKVYIKDTIIQNNSFQILSIDTPAIKMDGMILKDNTGIWDEAIDLLNSGMFEDAIRYFDEFIASYPDNYDAYIIKGDTLFYLGRYKEAIECYDEALKVSPNNITALLSKANSLNTLGRYTEASRCFSQVLEMEPGNIDALCGQANILFYQKKYEEAIKGYDKLIDIRPDFYIAYNNKGVVLFELGRYEESIECFDKVIEELNPFEVNVYYWKARSLVKLNRFSEAISNLKTSIEMFPAIKDNIKSDAAFDSLRGMDEFKVLIK